jgi:hypothetical protein
MRPPARIIVAPAERLHVPAIYPFSFFADEGGLVINLKTAKTLSLNIPTMLLATADELIE